MSDVVQGKNVRVQKDVSGVFHDIGCGIDCQFSVTNTFLGTTIRTDGSGPFIKRRKQLTDCTGSVSGVTKTTNSGGLSVFHFLEEAVMGSAGNYRFIFEDDNGDEIVITMSAFVEATNISGNMGDMSRFDLNVLGNGGFAMSELAAPDSPIADEPFSDTWILAEGETSISGPSSVHAYSLVGKEIIDVAVEGLGYDPTTGTPGNRQYVFDSGAGTITFEYEAPSGGQRVFVEFKDA